MRVARPIVVGAVAAIGCVVSGSPAFAAGLVWSAPTLIDTTPPLAHGNVITGLACPSSSLCVAVDGAGNVLTTRDPVGGAAAWTTVNLIDGTLGGFTGLACPSARFCAAVDNNGDVVTSTDPIGGREAWKVVRVKDAYTVRTTIEGFLDISCPTSSFCAVIDGSGNVLTSTRPTGGRRAWRVVLLTPPPIVEGQVGFGDLASVACRSRSLCLAGTDDGRVFSSRRPGRARSWRSIQLPGADSVYVSCALRLCVATHSGHAWIASNARLHWMIRFSYPALGPVSCSSDGRCAAVSGGNVAVSGAGAQGWKVARADRESSLGTVTCPSPSICVAGDDRGGIATTAGPGGSWILDGVDGSNELTGLSCPSPSLCIATDLAGRVGWSSGGSWHYSTVTPVGFYGVNRYLAGGLSCGSNSLCAALDSNGVLYVSTDPTGGTSAWKETNLEPAGYAGAPHYGKLFSVACTAAEVCVADDANGHIFTSTDPAGGIAAWKRSTLPGPIHHDTGNLSCSTSVCALLDGSSEVLASTSPTTGPWSPIPLSGSYYGMSCAPDGLCAAFGDSGVATSATPTSAPWNELSLGSRAITAVGCANELLCVAGDDLGTALVSTNPGAAGSTWTAAVIDPSAIIESIACPSEMRCLAVGDDGRIEVGTPPT